MAGWARRGSVGGITVTETPEATVAHLWGEIDDALRQQAGAVLARALDRNLPIVLDTGRVEFIDSAGIAFLIQLCTIGREEGLAVTLHDPPAVVSEVIEMLGLTELFDGQTPAVNA
ncbi:MAG: STAS domain-containing protein [Actinotalea sp.]|nr:STAS domain-containing protein [Actinotalea sp.]